MYTLIVDCSSLGIIPSAYVVDPTGQIVDLTYYKFTYNNIEYTQKDLIIHMIKLVNEAIDMDMYDEKYSIIVDEILDLWKMVFHCMWW